MIREEFSRPMSILALNFAANFRARGHLVHLEVVMGLGIFTDFLKIWLTKLLLPWKWKWLRRALRVRWVCWFILGGIPAMVLVVLWMGLEIVDKKACSDNDSKLYLEELCGNYSKGFITGSLCNPLCITKEIQFQKCFGGGMKLHVLQAEWNGKFIVLKTPNHHGRSKAGRLTQQQFIKQANASIFRHLTRMKYDESTLKVLEDVFAECDLHKDGILNHDETEICWQLIESDSEYVLYSLLQGNSGIPRVYGTCGNMYAVEHASSELLKAMGQQDWKVRTELSLALLDMIESLEETPYGPLHLCDVQAINFGIVRLDGKLVAKAIDVDMTWFEGSRKQSMVTCDEDDQQCCHREHGRQQSCCLVQCVTDDCSQQKYLLSSNNLQTFCVMMFRPNAWQPKHLLLDPPGDIKSQLEALVKKCINPGSRLNHVPRDLFEELRDLLHSSIV